MSRSKWVFGFIALAAVAATAVVLVRRGETRSEEKYRTERVDRGDVSMTVTATGVISAVTTVQVGSQVSGLIARLHADFNSRVRHGQLLAELDPTSFEAQVEQRRADLVQNEVQMRNAEIGFRRQTRLLEEGLSPDSDFDAAKAAFDSAKARVDLARASLDQAETNLRYTRIVSPIDGVVVARQFDVGQTVAASFQAPTLFTIAQDLTKMQVQADVDQSDIGRVAVGQSARFSVDAYPEQTFEGKIAQIRLNATVNQNVITYPVILEVPNPEEKLRPQMTANVSIEVATVHDVLRVPNAALRFRPPEPERGEKRSARASSAHGSGPPSGSVAASTDPPPRRVREPGGSLSSRPAPGPDERSAFGERRGGLQGAAEALDGARRPGKGKGGQTVYVVTGRDSLKAIHVRTGISDGRFTEVVDGSDLEPGERIVVGLATKKTEATPMRSFGRGPMH